MTTKAKEAARHTALEKLQEWHLSKGIKNFPLRLGLSVNEKKFREVSFRAPDGVDFDDAEPEDFIISHVPVQLTTHDAPVAHHVMYRVWYPTPEGKVKSTITIRFSLHHGVIGVIKVGNFFISVEADSFPLQRKMLGLARMFGITKSKDLTTLGELLVTKEFPFFVEHIKKFNVTQLGYPVYIDPSTRHEENIYLLIELELKDKYETKEDLAKIIDHRNPQMLLHHIFTEKELYTIYRDHLQSFSGDEVENHTDYRFRDHNSMHALSAYFMSKLD